MNAPGLLRAGAGAVTGAVLALTPDVSLRTLAAVMAAICFARFRATGALALVLGFASAYAHAHVAQTHVREHTIRLACTFLDAGICRADDGTVYAAELTPQPPLASRVELRGRLEAFDGPRNPGEPSMNDIERERGVQFQIASAHVLRTLASPAPSLDVDIARMHAWALDRIRSSLDEPYATILAGELWGERANLPPQLKTEFQETGTVHILVTAGLHLGVVALVLLALLRRLRLPRAACGVFAIGGVWAYAIFSGMHIPSVRAATMISFGLAAYTYGAAPVSWNAYGAALLVFALLRPESVTGASFALSFSCVGAIALLARPIERALEHFALPHAVRETLTLALATQAGTWPLTAAIFLVISPLAVLANVLVVPAVALTMVLALPQILFAGTLLGSFAADANGILLAWIERCVTNIAALPYAYVPVIAPPVIAIAAYDAAVLFAVAAWNSRGRTFAAASVALAICFILFPPPDDDTRLRITVLDVGQADAIVIRTPLGHTLLVDAGGRLERGSSINGDSTAENVGERTVVPFLRRSGVRHIDAILLSHPHGDHAGGIAPVLRNYGQADMFADSGQKYGGYAYNDALTTARADGVPLAYPRAGDVWRLDDGVTLRFIGPSLPFIESNNTINDNSIAFILEYKHFRMLFTGDAGVAAEQRFLNEGIDLHADVLKVGHHGSAYSGSPAFIAAVHPQYAIISVGRHNMFGHPAPSTVETLQRFGARVYRTDENGGVSITTNGGPAVIAAMIPDR